MSNKYVYYKCRENRMENVHPDVRVLRVMVSNKYVYYKSGHLLQYFY